MVQQRPPANAITVAVVATRIVAALQLALGFATFAIGVASIVILTSTAHFADQYGMGLFGGVFICLAGFVGMYSSFLYNNRYLCMLNLLCNCFIWFMVLVLLILFGLAADYYSRLKGADYCFRIRDIPLTAYDNRQDYNLRLKDPICLTEQQKVAPDGFTFSLCLIAFFGIELFVGAAAIIVCCKALYGMCGGTTPRVQGGQKYAFPSQTQKPVDYGKGYEMKNSSQQNANYPPPAYGAGGSGSDRPPKPQSNPNPKPVSTYSAPPPKKDNSAAAPSYFL